MRLHVYKFAIFCNAVYALNPPSIRFSIFGRNGNEISGGEHIGDGDTAERREEKFSREEEEGVESIITELPPAQDEGLPSPTRIAEDNRMKDKTDEEELNVIISGGGPGGLLASILINNIGIKSTVIERPSEPDQWSSKSYALILNCRGTGSLERGACLESAMAAADGTERHWIYFFDGWTGEVKTIPTKSPGIGLSRPLLVECLEKIACELLRVALRKGVGVSSVTNDEEFGLRVHLEDDTIISATHVIGADGKWSKDVSHFRHLTHKQQWSHAQVLKSA